jgi:hypothetical protein
MRKEGEKGKKRKELRKKEKGCLHTPTELPLHCSASEKEPHPSRQQK